MLALAAEGAVAVRVATVGPVQFPPGRRVERGGTSRVSPCHVGRDAALRREPFGVESFPFVLAGTPARTQNGAAIE